MAEINPIQFSVTDTPVLQHGNSTQTVKSSIFTGNISSVNHPANENKTQKFNSDGTVTISYDYDNDGNIDTELIKDSNGQQKEVINYAYGERTFEDGRKVPLKIAEHDYYEKGKRIASAKCSIIHGKEVNREEFTYTENGTSKTYAKYENGKLVSRSETDFYKDGEIVPDCHDVEKEERIYDKNNQLKLVIEYTYPKDKKGNVIANVEKETNVQTGEVVVRRYDENNPKVLEADLHFHS